MKIYLPENLDIKKIIETYPPTEIPNFSKKKLAIILSQIYHVDAQNKNIKDEDGYVPLYSAILQRLVRDYRKYLDYAVRTKIILEKYFFLEGERSRHFRFAEDYQTPMVDFIDEKTGVPLILKIKQRNIKELPKKFQFLKKHFESPELNIDFKSAMEFIKRRYEYKMKNPDKFPEDKNPVYQLNNAKFVWDRLQKRDYFWKFDDSGGRLHTNFTNLPKQLRHFITYSGIHLVTVDISNCQPVLINGLTSYHFYFCSAKICMGTKFHEKLLLECTQNRLDSTFNLSTVFPTLASWVLYQEIPSLYLHTLVNWVQTHAQKELQRFKEITTTGRYYDTLQEHLAKDVDPKFRERCKVKTESLRMLFTWNGFYHNPDAAAIRWFAEHFKGIYDIGWFIKKINKRYYPLLLQAMEAEIVINRVARRINRERPDLPFFTLHDCIATIIGEEDYVERIMKEEFRKCIGVIPHCKREYYGPESKGFSKLNVFEEPAVYYGKRAA